MAKTKKIRESISECFIKVPIYYQDRNLIFCYKPAYYLVHPFKSRSKERVHLMKILRLQTNTLPNPMHRLDRLVSGLTLFTTSKKTTAFLQDIWNTDHLQKFYIALVSGENLPEGGEFSDSLTNPRGKKQDALTSYQKIRQVGDYHLVKVQIHTGRSHQIRKHFSMNGFPLVGDPVYGNDKINKKFSSLFHFNRIFLHSYEMTIKTFWNNDLEPPLNIVSPLPHELEQILRLIEIESTLS